METVVMTDGISKRYGKTTALDDLHLEVREGEIFGFLGPNGAGKTTTIRILLNLIRPDSGTAHIFGFNTRKQEMQAKRDLGYLPGEVSLYNNLTPRQLFTYCAALNGVDGIGHAIELSERLGITDLDRNVGKLSQGNKQKVGLVQALLHQPRLLILDEPTNALDPLVRAELYDILNEARNRGTTVFFSSHVLAEAEAICDRVAIIRDGRLTRVGSVTELKSVAPRRVLLTFDGPAPVDAYTALPDLTEIQQPATNMIELTTRGIPEDLIQVLSAHPPSDIIWQEMSLEEIFLGYYRKRSTYQHDA